MIVRINPKIGETNFMKNFVAALDTPGGQMFMCALLLMVCIYRLAPMDAAQMMQNVGYMATGALFGAMKGQNGGRVTLTPPPPPGTTARVDTATTKTETTDAVTP